jgi:hypothetical protein
LVLAVLVLVFGKGEDGRMKDGRWNMLPLNKRYGDECGAGLRLPFTTSI